MDPHPINVLSLCSGGGGLDAGLQLALPNARTVCYVENEITAAYVLAQAIEGQWLDPAPFWSDLKTISLDRFRGSVDAVIGGYPCQPFSFAGKRQGVDDPRHLWPFIREIVRELEPTFCFFENVEGHLNKGYFDVVKPELEGLGFRVKEGLFTAREVGASHRRRRLFILAYRREELANSDQQSQQFPSRSEPPLSKTELLSRGMANTDNAERRENDQHEQLRCERKEEICSPRGSCSCLDDPSIGGSGQLSVRSGQSGSTTALLDRPISGVADPDRRPVHDATSGPPDREGRTPPEWASESMGDADDTGWEGRRQSLRERAHELVAWPPGPTDMDGWRRFLERAPGLEPAVRRGSDGLANRSDQLHVLGNGVVPLEAALAFTTLATQMREAGWL